MDIYFVIAISGHKEKVFANFSHMIALQMAEEDKAYTERAAEWEKFKTQQLGANGGAEGGPMTTVMSE